MSVDERSHRWERMREAVFSGTAAHWCDNFLEALESLDPPTAPVTPDAA